MLFRSLAGWGVAGRVIYAGVLALASAALWCLAYSSGGLTAVPRDVNVALFGASLVFWLTAAPLWMARGWRAQSLPVMAVTGLLLLLPLWWALVVLQARPLQLLALMALVWISDSAAYLCGRLWGRRKLAVTISPGKTWEGLGGALLCIAVYAAVLQYMDSIAQDEKMLVPYLLAMTLFSVEGDLLESWLKRCAGVKDSGTILPGHGGILDRIDALTSALPLAAWLFAAQ